jgi:hypothetical protein
MHTYTITFGGWYQRTTLHLTEIYDLFTYGTSRLKLSPEKLESHRKKLDLVKVTRETGNFEYVQAETADGIKISYYEDGLYVLSKSDADIDKASKKISDYFENVFEPAISYIFSLGAPTPKELAKIKISHPTVVSLTKKEHSSFAPEAKYGQVYNVVRSKNVSVYKTPGYIFVVSDAKDYLRELIETQIFFREFKDQLEKYLNIHRKIWEEIDDIKERGAIRGREVAVVRDKLDRYQKTINLITNRLNQMGTYIDTRQIIARNMKIEKEMVELFQYKFETLKDTHIYVKELWIMTLDYLKSAIQIIVEIENQNVNASIQSLRTITMVGVVSGVLGYMANDALPQVSYRGMIYFFMLFTLTWSLNRVVARYYKDKKYRIKFTETSEEI